MEKPFTAYRGDGPYVFVCYAHEDSDAVYREIAWLNDYGVNVWYDEGISPGHEWREELAAAIQSCTRVLFFVTPSSVVSEHCRRELNFAQEENREVVAIYLEPTEMPAGLRLGLNNRQAILKHQLSEEEFHKRLMRAIQSGGSPAVASNPAPVEKAPRSKAILPLSAVALLAVVIVIWWLFLRGAVPEAIDPARVAENAPAATILRNSVAILPFANLSPDPDNAYFAAGIHEEILNQLAKIKDISVIARTTMLRYADSEQSVPEIGRELNVGTVMEGSVRYAGDRVRITSQLIDVSTGAHLWSESYDRDVEDIFEIQSDIALRITGSMKAEFNLSERQIVARPPTQNMEAYTHYVRAQALITSAPPDIIGALREYDNALKLDPNFAIALATKAAVHGYAAMITAPGVPRTLGMQTTNLALARQYADRALAIDPNQGNAYVARSVVSQSEQKWREALDHARRAYELSRTIFTANNYGQWLLWFDQHEQALALFEETVQLDPLNASIPRFIAPELLNAGDPQNALRFAQQARLMTPERFEPYFMLAWVHTELGNSVKANEFVRTAESMENFNSHWLPPLMYLNRLLNNLDELERLSVEFHRLEREGFFDPFDLAGGYIALGDTERSFEYLEQVVDHKFPIYPITNIALSPQSSAFGLWREDPKFEMLRAQLPVP